MNFSYFISSADAAARVNHKLGLACKLAWNSSWNGFFVIVWKVLKKDSDKNIKWQNFWTIPIMN